MAGMLVLSRKVDDVVFITDDHGDKIAVKVLEIRRGGKVSLGFGASAKFKIVREELLKKIGGEA